MNSAFKVRKPVADDVEYIMKTWCAEVYHAQPKRPALLNGRRLPVWPARLFFRQYQTDVIIPLVAKADCRVVCPEADANIIECFVVAKHLPEANICVVHFAYTRLPLRRLGLCRAALQDIGWREGEDELVATEWTRGLAGFTRDDLILNRLALYGVK